MPQQHSSRFTTDTNKKVESRKICSPMPKTQMLFNTVLRAKCTPNLPCLASSEHWEGKHCQPLNIHNLKTISRDSRRKRCCDVFYIHSYRSEMQGSSKKYKDDERGDNCWIKIISLSNCAKCHWGEFCLPHKKEQYQNTCLKLSQIRVDCSNAPESSCKQHICWPGCQHLAQLR